MLRHGRGLVAFAGLALACGGADSSSASDELNTQGGDPAGTTATATGTPDENGGAEAVTSPTASGAGGSSPEGNPATPAGEGGSVAISPEGSAGGTAGPPACTAENQPQTRGSNDQCFSPFYNTALHTNSDVLGCDCQACDHTGVCIGGTQYLCANTWAYKEAGDCSVPNACTELWLKTFRSDTIEDCERLAGGLIIGDDPDAPVSCQIELTFTDSLREERQAAGSRTGQWRCDGMNVTGIFGPTEIQGSYDPTTDVLVWDGMQMQHTDTIVLP
jgi:hypothetical protein